MSSPDENEMWWEQYTHLTPRIDDDKFQCAVPEWDPEVTAQFLYRYCIKLITFTPPQNAEPQAEEPDQSVVQWDPKLLKNGDIDGKLQPKTALLIEKKKNYILHLS
jgi:hypothetical protein